MVDLGQHVSLGMNLGLCFSTAKAEVRLPIAEHKLALLNLNQKSHSPSKIMLTTDSPKLRQQWPAKLSRAESVIDERNRMLYLVAEIQDPYQLERSATNTPLRIGSFVSAKIIGKTINNIFRVPQSVIQSDNSVWVINNNGQLQRKKLTIIMIDSDYAFVSEGLSDNDNIAAGFIDPSVSGRKVNIAQRIRLAPLTEQDLVSPQNLLESNKRHSLTKKLTTETL